MIELVGGQADAVMDFRVFAESKPCRERLSAVFRDGGRLPRMKYRGAFAERNDILQQRNRQGFGIFYSSNPSDGAGVKNNNIVAVRALPLDLDTTRPPADWDGGLRPHVLIESSPGRFQALFMIEPTTAFDEAARMAKRLAMLYGGDPNVSDRARVLRLPGFVHQKAKPFRSRIVWIDHFAAPFTLDDFDVILPPLPKRRIGIGDSGVGLIDAKRAALLFEHYPVEAIAGNAAWQRFAMALHSACNGNEAVAELFFKFCMQDSAYDDDDDARNRMRWDSFHAERDGGLTIGTLKRLCTENRIPGAVRFALFNDALRDFDNE
ncbi:hypothetical protein OO17_02185 [Rhodopseudomonas palustris]|uniref:Uncharacterized protein n=1 Tax=Rhodopseudomonas palustris TaxID=1076 RepID=A0A0D7F446_RHOPL|nr:hypothetical protein OO17_02185 [Rhodopseudomonas palustris]